MSTTFNYQEYLASREWALLKNRVRERSGGICERCKKAPQQATHHKTYERIGHESLDDLLGVCNPCHEWLSGKTDDDPLTRPPEPLRPVPLPFAEKGGWGWPSDEQLICPSCQFDYVHLVGVRTIATGDNYEAGFVRGHAIRIHFFCENGCHFSMDVGFHKGGTFFRVAPEWFPTGDGATGECEECPRSKL
jgi:hypothetical protein